MFRGFGKREAAGWTVIVCLLAFGAGAVLVKRLRPAGPMEFRELPPREVVTPNQSKPENNYTEPKDPQRIEIVRPPPRQNEAPANPVSTPTVSSVPASDPAPTKSHGKAKPEPAPQSISLNQSDVNELQQLPGVGPSIAQRIIDYRTEHGPFRSLDELRNVKGIGEKRFARMEPYLRL